MITRKGYGYETSIIWLLPRIETDYFFFWEEFSQVDPVYRIKGISIQFELQVSCVFKTVTK